MTRESLAVFTKAMLASPVTPATFQFERQLLAELPEHRKLQLPKKLKRLQNN